MVVVYNRTVRCTLVVLLAVLQIYSIVDCTTTSNVVWLTTYSVAENVNIVQDKKKSKLLLQYKVMHFATTLQLILMWECI